MNAQRNLRNLREGAWVSESESRGEIQKRENLVSNGVIVSESDSQAKENETQERVRA